jgi:hypothetical protein
MYNIAILQEYSETIPKSDMGGGLMIIRYQPDPFSLAGTATFPSHLSFLANSQCQPPVFSALHLAVVCLEPLRFSALLLLLLLLLEGVEDFLRPQRSLRFSDLRFESTSVLTALGVVDPLTFSMDEYQKYEGESSSDSDDR